MSKILKVIVSVTALLTLTSPLLAQSQDWAKVGGLSCAMAPTIGLLVVSEQKLNCTFTPSGSYPPEHYAGTMGTVGIDVGVIGGGLLAWAVYMPTEGPPQGSLAGTHSCSNTTARPAIGAGANVLLGGSARSVMLQPISVEGSVGVEVTLGVAALTLQSVP